jgi:hypothetical protein
MLATKVLVRRCAIVAGAATGRRSTGVVQEVSGGVVVARTIRTCWSSGSNFQDSCAMRTVTMSQCQPQQQQQLRQQRKTTTARDAIEQWWFIGRG